MAVKSLNKGYLALAASMLLVAQAQATELLNSSYDVSRELFAALNRRLNSSGRKIMPAIS
jgi:sulfate transport system substrate-binding protein